MLVYHFILGLNRHGKEREGEPERENEKERSRGEGEGDSGDIGGGHRRTVEAPRGAENSERREKIGGERGREGGKEKESAGRPTNGQRCPSLWRSNSSLHSADRNRDGYPCSDRDFIIFLPVHSEASKPIVDFTKSATSLPALLFVSKTKKSK